MEPDQEGRGRIGTEAVFKYSLSTWLKRWAVRRIGTEAVFK